MQLEGKYSIIMTRNRRYALSLLALAINANLVLHNELFTNVDFNLHVSNNIFSFTCVHYIGICLSIPLSQFVLATVILTIYILIHAGKTYID